jgi:hypothetical protein
LNLKKSLHIWIQQLSLVIHPKNVFVDLSLKVIA